MTYLLLLLAVRLLGKRMAMHLPLFELSMVVTLAAAIVVPLQVPDRSMLPPMIILAVTVGVQCALTAWGMRQHKVERLTTGNVTLLLCDGHLLLQAMRRAVLSREQIFATLHDRGIQHLGQVQRLFLEASGDFTVLQACEPRPGLSLIPGIDPELRGQSAVPGHFACASCGQPQQVPRLPDNPCPYCGSTAWTEAVTELDE